MLRPTALLRSPIRRRSGAAALLQVAAALPPVVVAAGLSLVVPLPDLRAQTPAAAAAAAQPSAAMAELAARQAAERILRAVRSRDAKAYYSLLAPEPQRVSSPVMAAQALNRLPKLESWRISEIVPGVESSSVTALLSTAVGPREVLMVIDGRGRLEGYHVNVSDARAEDVVKNFMEALTEGRFITASSFLSESLQAEIPQSELQRKWLNLQTITGNFQRIRRISRAERSDQMKLVIVSAQFNRLTDNLFVTLDNDNQIIGVDFPVDPTLPRSGTTP